MAHARQPLAPTATPRSFWLARVAAVCMFLLSALSAAGGCKGGEPGESPAATVRHFLEAMDRSGADASGLADAYGLLSSSAREALAERARRTSALTGVDMEPWRMLAQGRFRLRFAPESPGGLKEHVDGERATVTVTGKGPGKRAEIPMVKEGGKWRIRLEIPPLDRDGS